jgi:hypothetical protein
MNWEKLGKIFDPSEFNLGDGYSVFAKSPQALVFQDFIRIYFCAQKLTEDGKYLSRPHYVDFDPTLQSILNVSTNPVIDLGELGCFDEHGIFPMNVLRHDERILAFTTGWSRRNSVSIEMAIGFAESFDNGATFTKVGLGGPCMSLTLKEPNLIGDAFVRFYDGTFHMWYIFGNQWQRATQDSDPDRFYRIAYASSSDGINWRRDGRYIIEAKLENECQALPTVFTYGERHHMIFCYRDAFNFRSNRNRAYRLGYAYSLDGLTWTRSDNQLGIDVSVDDWDSDMMCYPHVFECNGAHYLLYNGNEFGRYGFGAARLTGL